MADSKSFAQKILAKPSEYGVSLGIVAPGDATRALDAFLSATDKMLFALSSFRSADIKDYVDGKSAFGSMIRKPKMAPTQPVASQPTKAKTTDDLARPRQTGSRPTSKDDTQLASEARKREGDVRLLAEYFANVFQRIGQTKFNNLGPHAINGQDLFHGHLIKGWDGGSYIVFHAKEFPDDLGMEEAGGYESTDPPYAYRNVLWKGATRELFALDARGDLDDMSAYLYKKDSSPIFKNLVFPFACATMPPDLMEEYWRRYIGAKTVYETYLGVPRSILCYRWLPNIPDDQRVIFNEQTGPGNNATWNESKLDALLKQTDPADPTDLSGLFQMQDTT